MLGQRLPMAALYVSNASQFTNPRDLCAATYGGETNSAFVMEHLALLRRLGHGGDDLHVEVRYEDLPGALAGGRIDVIPDYAGLRYSYQLSVPKELNVEALPYRDCGVLAYGTVFVGSKKGLETKREALRRFLAVARSGYEAMRSSPESVVDEAAALLPEMDRSYALTEWLEEEEEVLFEFGELGATDPSLWAATVEWRAEVAGFPSPPDPRLLHESLEHGPAF